MHSLSIDMPTDQVGLRRPVPRLIPTYTPDTRNVATVDFGAAPNRRGFVTMLSDYHDSGGLARGNNLARLLDDWQCGNFISLARLIAADEIFSFSWHAESWIPMFQFDLRDLSVKPGPSRVMAELKPVFDDWALAVWFVRPNSWLQAKRPLDLIDSDLTGVLEAARADRFVTAG